MTRLLWIGKKFGYYILGVFQLGADCGGIFRGVLGSKVMEEAVAMVNGGEKNRVRVVKPTLVLHSLFRCGVLGSSKDGRIEIRVGALGGMILK